MIVTGLSSSGQLHTGEHTGEAENQVATQSVKLDTPKGLELPEHLLQPSPE